MKKTLSLGVVSLLALTASARAVGQVGGASAKGVVERSSAGQRNATGTDKLEPASAIADASTTGSKKVVVLPSTESSSRTSTSPPHVVSEAPKEYSAGVALLDSGKPDEAIRAFKQAIELSPKDPPTHFMLGMAYWKTKSYSRSVDSFKRSLRLRPDWAEAHFRLGLAYYVLGQTKQAKEAYKKLLALNSPLAQRLYQLNNENRFSRVDERSETNLAGRTTTQVQTASVSPPPLAVAPKAESKSSNSETDHSSKAGATSNPAFARGNESRNLAPEELNTSPALSGPSQPAASPVRSDLTVIDSNLSDDSAQSIYKVGLGDVLDIRMLNSAGNRSTLYTVMEGGLIDLPIAGGAIAVAGLTTRDIEQRISSELKRLELGERTQVSVGVRQYASHAITVTGLVVNPGTRFLRREAVPLYVLLAEAQPRPDAARAAVMREGMPTRFVGLTDSAALSFIVRPGDVINLIAQPQTFYYIAGRVGSPGQKVFQPGITMVQAILAAGGSARGTTVELSRERTDGRLATAKFNLKDIKSGKIQDPKIEPGDRIEVLN